MTKPPEFYDRSRQPRCPDCGRFAYWDDQRNEWCLRCVTYNMSDGVWEHE